LKSRFGGRLAHETLSLHFAGLAESAVDEALQPVIRRASHNLDFTILGGHGLTHFYVTATGPSRAAAQRVLASVKRALPRSLRAHLYSEGDETLEAAVGSLLRVSGRTLAVAESCTGGLLSTRLTIIAGSSDYFLGGVVAYSNNLKSDVLGVAPETLRAHGAVAAPTALEMAEGARRRFRSDYALSVTGIAGPGGGTPQKPVGLVFIGLAMPDGQTQVVELMAHGDRQRIRSQSANAALDLLRKALQ
jgi:nicotinamide-nucleotide amidase